MDQARIAALLAPFLAGEALSAAQLRQVAAYLELLQRWNRKINLTAVRRPEEMMTRHFGESFFAARSLLPADSRLDVFDLGSGAGFPGLPMKLYRPQIRLTLIESQHKKAAFLREAARTLRLTDVNVFAGRAETLGQASRANLVMMRAVERFARSLAVASSLVAPGGRLALMVGKSQIGAAQASFPGWKWDDQQWVPQSLTRCLLVGWKPSS